MHEVALREGHLAFGVKSVSGASLDRAIASPVFLDRRIRVEAYGKRDLDGCELGDGIPVMAGRTVVPARRRGPAPSPQGTGGRMPSGLTKARRDSPCRRSVMPEAGANISVTAPVGNLASSDGASPSICVERVISECALAAALRDHAGIRFHAPSMFDGSKTFVIGFSRQTDVATLSPVHPDSKSQAIENGSNGSGHATETLQRSRTSHRVLMGHAGNRFRVADSRTWRDQSHTYRERTPAQTCRIPGWLSAPLFLR